MSDQPQPARPPLPKWLTTLLLVAGGLHILAFLFLITAQKTLGWPPPIPWRLLGSGFIWLTLGLCLQARAKPGP